MSPPAPRAAAAAHTSHTTTSTPCTTRFHLCMQGWINPDTALCPGTPVNKLVNISFNHPEQLAMFMPTLR
jgi:hypothetical protein